MTVCGWGVGYYVLHLRRVFVVELWDAVVDLYCVLCDVRQGKRTLKLLEPLGWLFGPERRFTTTDALDSESRIGRLPRPCWWVSVLMHAAFAVGIVHLLAALRSLQSRQGHQCGGIGINYQTHTVICAHNTLFLPEDTISVAGRVLAACLSRVSLSPFAVLTCNRNCSVRVSNVVVLGR